MADLAYATASELARRIRHRELSAVELLDAYLDRIDRYNPVLNAIVTLDADSARRQAAEADRALARGEAVGPLHGVPMTLKDCHATAALRTTAGFPPLADYVPSEDSVAVARLRAAGAIILGKTNVPPLATHIQTDNPLFGRTSNPWNLARTPGGSSGGAAAALAAGLTPLEIGSDTAASIRIPAHFCGVFGLKPTHSRVPLAGHIPDLPEGPRIDRELTVIGPLARSVEDLALAFRIIAGPDPRDPLVPPLPYREVAPPSLSTLRIAWAPAFPDSPVAADCRSAIEHLASTLASQGGRVELALPPADLFRQLREFWQGYFQIRRYLKGTFHGDIPAEDLPSPAPTLADLYRALEQRDAFILAWEQFFAEWDVLLCPVGATTAFEHCERDAPVLCDGTPIPYREVNYHCVPFSVTGHPAVVLPIGLDRQGLPMGIQVVTRRWDEERLLAIASALAEITGPFRRPPGY